MDNKTLSAALTALAESADNPQAVIDNFEQEAKLREFKANRELAEARAFRQMIAAIQALRGDAPDQEPETPSEREPGTISTNDTAPPGQEIGRTFSTPDRPAGIDAIRRVMREGGVWNAKALLAELERRGWEPKNAKHPRAATEAALNRLWKVKGEVERVGRGQYTYKGFPGTPTLEAFTGRAEP